MEDICDAIIRLKEQLAENKKNLAELESELVDLGTDKLEGSETIKSDHYKVTLTHKLNRKLDIQAYEAMDLPEGHQFVEYKPAINLKRMRAVEQVDPGVVESCTTVTPAKTSVKVEVL